MKYFAALFISALFLSALAFPDTKLSELPLGSGASVGPNDSFPYVQVSPNPVTKRLKLFDIPAMGIWPIGFSQHSTAGFILQANGTTFVSQRGDASTFSYHAGNTSNWVGSFPIMIQEALDRIAALLKTLNGNNPVP